MPYLPIRLGRSHWRVRNDTYSFQPEGVIYFGDAIRRNPPVTWSRPGVCAGRIVLALARNGKRTGTVRDVSAAVAGLQRSRGQTSTASVASQSGVYEHKSDGKIAVEHGAQVAIISTERTTVARFSKGLVKIAEALAAEFKQEEVLVEVQKDGVVVRHGSVTPS